MPKRDRRAERREATRREIVDAAWEVARESGLADLTLRAVAERVGMQPPSLYSHFVSKNAIYDAMFGQAWSDYEAVADSLEPGLPSAPRRAMLTLASSFVEFCVADHARFQLMNQRVVVDFEPSAESYAPSVRVMSTLTERLRRIGVSRTEDIDLLIAMLGGLIDVQFANDPGGTRWTRLVPRAIDMFADDLGLPGPRLRRTR